ncbi:hypothetical protein [Streptomyces sp. NPDC054961]
MARAESLEVGRQGSAEAVYLPVQDVLALPGGEHLLGTLHAASWAVCRAQKFHERPNHERNMIILLAESVTAPK